MMTGGNPADEDDEPPLHKNHEAYFVPGLHRGLLVMEMIADERRAMSVTEIAQRLGLTRSSVFRLIYTLRHMGFLETSPDRKEVALGPRVLNIGFAYLASKDIIDLAGPDLELLRDETNVSTHLAIRDEADILYLSCFQSRSSFHSNMNVGARLPAHATPLGWLLLANLAPREIARMYENKPLTAMSPHTPTDLPSLLRCIADAAALGYVVSRGFVEYGGSSVSAPIHDRHGKVVGAIDISGPDSVFELDQIGTRYVDAVVSTAKQISRRLGYARS